MQIQELKCFGARPGDGNPALAITGDRSPQAQRLDFARTHQRPACVFIDRSDDPQAPWVLDYYYPHMRSPLCLHATLAAAALLAADGPVTVRTAMHGQSLQLSRRGDAFYIALMRQNAPAPAVDARAVAALLGMAAPDFAAAPALASVGSPKLLLRVADSAALYALRPDLPAIVAWGKPHGVNGFYVYCERPDGDFEGRNFNHLDAALEDGATGVAAGALSALLGRGLRLHQGRATGRACLMQTELSGDAILVGGAVCAG